MPLGRFLNVLKEKKPQYMRLLKESFNPETSAFTDVPSSNKHRMGRYPL